MKYFVLYLHVNLFLLSELVGKPFHGPAKYLALSPECLSFYYSFSRRLFHGSCISCICLLRTCCMAFATMFSVNDKLLCIIWIHSVYLKLIQYIFLWQEQLIHQQHFCKSQCNFHPPAAISSLQLFSLFTLKWNGTASIFLFVLLMMLQASIVQASVCCQGNPSW